MQRPVQGNPVCLNEPTDKAFQQFLIRRPLTFYLIYLWPIAAPAQVPASKQQLGDRRQNDPTARSEEHTSELQSRPHLVCRLPLEKKNKHSIMALALRHLRNHVIGQAHCRQRVPHGALSRTILAVVVCQCRRTAPPPVAEPRWPSH